MKKNIFYLFAFVILFCAQSFAQSGDVRGFIYSEKDGEPIPFCNVYLFVEGNITGGQSDINGFYTINKVPVGVYTLYAYTIGFDTAKATVEFKENRIATQKFFMKESSVKLKDLVITGKAQEKREQTKVSAISISAREISKIPSVGGEPDLAQYLQVLPGIVSTGDQGGQLYIRGGSPIQTKVLLDGMTIYNPFHSIGLFSVFETDVIRNVDVLTGGFNAEYGGRVSAVVDITTRDGNKKRLAGKVAANPFTSKILLEGPISKLNDDGGSTSFIASAKTSYLDKSSKTFYSYIDSAGLPYSFLDLYGKLSINAPNGSKVSLFGFNHRDQAKFLNTADFNWNSFGFGGDFNLIPGQSKTIINGNLNYTKYDIELLESGSNARTSSIGGFDFGLDFTYFLKDSELKYGLDIMGYSTEFEFFNQRGFRINQDQNTTELGGYVKYRLSKEKFVVEPSLRSQLYASVPEFTFEPRISAKFNVSDKFRLKGATGYYKQNFISTKSDLDVVNLFTGFLSAPEEKILGLDGEDPNSKLQSAIHGVFGFEYDPTNYIEVNIEGYYKDFTQLINLNRNKTFPTEPDYQAEKGDAYGVDFLVNYQKEKLFLWAVYSLGFVNRYNGQQTYPPHFDRRHNINLLGSYEFGKKRNLEFSVRWNIGSGFPFTQTQGFYELLDFADGINTDYRTANGDLGIIFDDKINGGRLPFYHRLDMSVKKNFSISETVELQILGSVTNVYNRDNIFYFDRINYERVDQLPILPSLGVSLSF